MSLVRSGWLVGVVLALWVTPAWASNGALLQTVGTKGPVTIPIYGDPQTMYRFPSSIAWNLDHEVSVDLFWFVGTSTLENELNDFSSTSGTFGASAGVLFAPGRDAPGSVLDRLTFGVGVYPDIAAGGDSTAYRYQTYPQGIDVKTDLLFLNVSFVTTYRITDYLAVGLALQPIYGSLGAQAVIGGDSTPLDGSPQINGVPIPGNPTYSDFLNLFSNDADSDPNTYFESDDAVALHFSATLSITFSPMENLAFGISYRSRSIGQPFEGKGTVDANTTVGDAVGGLGAGIEQLFLDTLPNRGTQGFVSEYDSEIEGIYVPRQIRFSAVWWPVERVLLGFEVAWIEWHRAFKEADVRLTNGSNQDLNFIIGSRSVNSGITLNWKNQWVFSTYAAWQAWDDWTLRFGLNYGAHPLDRNEQGNSATPAFTEFHVSAGVGWRVLPELELNFLLEHGFANEVRSGDAGAPTANDSTYSSSQWFFHLGLNYRF